MAACSILADGAAGKWRSFLWDLLNKQLALCSVHCKLFYTHTCAHTHIHTYTVSSVSRTTVGLWISHWDSMMWSLTRKTNKKKPKTIFFLLWHMFTWFLCNYPNGNSWLVCCTSKAIYLLPAFCFCAMTPFTPSALADWTSGLMETLTVIVTLKIFILKCLNAVFDG